MHRQSDTTYTQYVMSYKISPTVGRGAVSICSEQCLLSLKETLLKNCRIISRYMIFELSDHLKQVVFVWVCTGEFMRNVQNVKKTIAEMVRHMSRRDAHELLDSLDKDLFRQVLKEMLEYVCGLKKVK